MSELSTARQSGSPDLIDRLFQKLALMYGKQWADLWIGVPIDAVKGEWARTLTGIEPEAMRLALDSMLNSGKPFPPTLPEFVSLCRQFRKTGAPNLYLADKRKTDGPSGGFQTLRNIIRAANERKS